MDWRNISPLPVRQSLLPIATWFNHSCSEAIQAKDLVYRTWKKSPSSNSLSVLPDITVSTACYSSCSVSFKEKVITSLFTLSFFWSLTLSISNKFHCTTFWSTWIDTNANSHNDTNFNVLVHFIEKFNSTF